MWIVCSVHKHTIQQVPDFIHVDLKVGNLQQNKTKKHGAADLCVKGERQEKGNDTDRERM